MPRSHRYIGISFAICLSLSYGDIMSHETSSEKDRKSLSVTIYNGGIGLVRETRVTTLPKGRSTLRYEDVASSILAQTVRVVPGKGSSEFSIFEQNYEFDLISNERLMEKYVGQNVLLFQTNPKTGEETSLEAKLIAYNNGPVYQIGDKISLGYPGRVVVPSLPQNLFSKPTLVWEMFSKEAGEKKFEVSYQTGGMNWSADYNLHLNEAENGADLLSWVTLSNSSGTNYRDATLQLVAGKIQLISHQPIPMAMDKKYKVRASVMMDGAEPEFSQENLSEYYLYTLDQPTDIGDRQTKQVQLFSQQGIIVEKKFIFENIPLYDGNQKRFTNATVRYDILNSSKNRLGRPLPAGSFRIFKSDSKGRVQLLGEDSIDHTPNDEWVRVSTGSAFDVVASGKQTKYEKFKISEGFKAGYEMEIRNRKKEDITVRVYAPVYGEWKITENSHKFEKESQSKVFFDLKIPAGKVEVVRYTVENKI